MVDEPCFGDYAVRHHGNVVLSCRDMSRAPVDLRNPALNAAFHPYQVAGPIWLLQPYRDAGEHVSERALQSQAEHDGYHARCCEQTRNRDGEGEVDDRETRADID